MRKLVAVDTCGWRRTNEARSCCVQRHPIRERGDNVGARARDGGGRREDHGKGLLRGQLNHSLRELVNLSERTPCVGPSSESSRFAPPPPGACRYDHGRKSRPRLPAKLTHGGGWTPRGTAPHLEPLPDARRHPISNTPRDKWMREAAKEAPISCCHASHQYLKSTDMEVLYLGQYRAMI